MTRKTEAARQATSYAGFGVAIGAGVGGSIGVLLGGGAIAIGVCLGAGLGLTIGAALDARQAEKPN